MRLIALAGGVAAACCGDGAREGDGSADGGLDQLADDILRARHDLAPLLVRLHAELTDYGEVFTGDTVVAAIRHYDGYWRQPRVLGPTDRHRTYRFSQVTTEELAAGTGARRRPSPRGTATLHRAPAARPHPAPHHVPRARADAGDRPRRAGSPADRWRLFPTPWLVLGFDEPGYSH